MPLLPSHAMHESSFGIIPLRYRREVFLVKHQAGHWAFPKGHPNRGEDPIKAAERELFEETGLKCIHYLKLEPLEETYTFFRKGKRVDKKVVYFLAEVDGEIKLQTEEIAEGKWVPLEKASDQLTFPEAKKVFRQAYEQIKSLSDTSPG